MWLGIVCSLFILLKTLIAKPSKSTLLFLPLWIITGLLIFQTQQEFKRIKAPPPRSIPAEDQLSILLHNVWRYADEWEPTFSLLENNTSDLVALQEVDTRFLKRLEANYQLLENYPYRAASVNDELMLLSKLPINRVRYHPVARRNDYVFMVLEAEITKGTHTFRVLVVHPPHPTTPIQHIEQQVILDEINKVVNSSNLPTIIAGDFNSTKYSPLLQKFVKRSRLKNAESVAPHEGTFPSQVPAFLRIDLDHILLKGAIKPKTFKVLPPTQSDHIPVRATLYFKD